MDKIEKKEDFIFDNLNTDAEESLEAMGVSIDDMIAYMDWFKTQSQQPKLSRAILLNSMWVNASNSQAFAKCLLINAFLGSSITDQRIGACIQSAAAGIEEDKKTDQEDPYIERCLCGHEYGKDCGDYEVCLNNCIECKLCVNPLECNNCNYLRREKMCEEKRKKEVVQ